MQTEYTYSIHLKKKPINQIRFEDYKEDRIIV